MSPTESEYLYILRGVRFEFLQKKNITRPTIISRLSSQLAYLGEKNANFVKFYEDQIRPWFDLLESYEINIRRKLRDIIHLRKSNEDSDNEEPDSTDFVLGPLDFKIAKGKLTSILGRSGSGKTTLLSILGLLRRPIQGSITINLDNKSYDTAEIWKDENRLEDFRANHIGFALQKGELLPYLTLYENAEIVLRFLRKDEKEIKDSVYGHFKRLYEQGNNKKRNEEKQNNPEGEISTELKSMIHRKPLAVSQGQYQRGAIARALANNPPILLADEPTGNLDEITAPQVIQIFREIVDKGVDEGKPQSVIIVTHDILLSIKFADEIIVLSKGQKRAHYIRQNEYWTNIDDKKEKYDASDFEKLLLRDVGE